MSIRPTLIPSRITIITQTSITIITITWINKLITAESQLQQQLTRDMWYYTSRSSSLAFIVIRDSSSFLKQDATKESREARDGKKNDFYRRCLLSTHHHPSRLWQQFCLAECEHTPPRFLGFSAKEWKREGRMTTKTERPPRYRTPAYTAVDARWRANVTYDP